MKIFSLFGFVLKRHIYTSNFKSFEFVIWAMEVSWFGEDSKCTRGHGTSHILYHPIPLLSQLFFLHFLDHYISKSAFTHQISNHLEMLKEFLKVF
jgi:hypothetical protein